MMIIGPPQRGQGAAHSTQRPASEPLACVSLGRGGSNAGDLPVHTSESEVDDDVGPRRGLVLGNADFIPERTRGPDALDVGESITRCRFGLFSADRALHWSARDLSCAFASAVHVVAQQSLDAGPERPLLSGDAQKAVGRGGTFKQLVDNGRPHVIPIALASYRA